MIIPDWYTNTVINDNYGANIWIKTTPTFHGVVISPKRMKLAPGEYSPRRYSVAIQYPGNHWELIIGSTYYSETGFDSEDIDEPLNKFYNGEFQNLVRVPTGKTVEMQELSEWDGSAQYLQRIYGYHLED